MPALPSATRFIGRYIVLDPMNIGADVAELFAISHCGDHARGIFQYLPSGPFETVDAMQEFWTSWCRGPGVLAFVVRDIATCSVLGTLSLINIRPEHGVAEIGNVWYAPEAQRTKTNTESVYLLMKHCFTDLGYRRIEWKCDARNRPSGIAALRLGFTFEGVFRKHMLVRGQNRDTAWFATIDDDWPSRQAAMETWLYTDNAIPLSQVHASRLPY